MLVLGAEKYLREVWPAVTKAVKEHHIACELNLVRSCQTVASHLMRVLKSLVTLGPPVSAEA